jgi:predicted SnoaL-like aldol condensation-catalyzing enzyme
MNWLIVLALFPLSSFAGLSENKDIVNSFYKEVFVHHRAKEGAEKFLSTNYKQHNPHVADGRQPFIDYFVPYYKAHPKAKAEIKRVLAEGDLVMVHVLSKETPDDRGRAVVDIFRVADGKIVEHWDVMQEIPEKSANSNTMF